MGKARKEEGGRNEKDLGKGSTLKSGEWMRMALGNREIREID